MRGRPFAKRLFFLFRRKNKSFRRQISPALVPPEGGGVHRAPLREIRFFRVPFKSRDHKWPPARVISRRTLRRHQKGSPIAGEIRARKDRGLELGPMRIVPKKVQRGREGFPQAEFAQKAVGVARRRKAVLRAPSVKGPERFLPIALRQRRGRRRQGFEFGVAAEVRGERHERPAKRRWAMKTLYSAIFEKRRQWPREGGLLKKRKGKPLRGRRKQAHLAGVRAFC